MTTLDELIAAHGEPAFCKIDVEGFEVEVLAGLTRPLRALSFEYLPMAHDAALAVLDRVGELGAYRYNYSPIETMRGRATAGWTRRSCSRCSTGTARSAAPATSTRAARTTADPSAGPPTQRGLRRRR